MLVWYQSIIYIVTALIDGVRKRFHPQLNDLDNMLCPAFHPQFKLSWLKDSIKIKVITERMIKLVNEKERLHANGKYTQNHQRRRTGKRAEIFSLLCTGSRLQKINGEKTTKSVPGNALGQVAANERFISMQGLSTFFLYNTAFPYSVAIERIFSVGQDLPKPKHAGISDEHLEMVVFLKD